MGSNPTWVSTFEFTKVVGTHPIFKTNPESYGLKSSAASHSADSNK
jgi:hypothetical protein